MTNLLIQNTGITVNQRRSKIPLLGCIFFAVIVFGSVADGKPGMLISVIAAALIIFCLKILRKNMPNKHEAVFITEEQLIFETAQQQSWPNDKRKHSV